jgi:hypothetical protein
MADLVAWSPIAYGDQNTDTNADPSKLRKVIKPGTPVTQGDLGLDDEQWKQLVSSGAVRTMPFPDIPGTYQDSPVNFMREQARKAADEALISAETSEENIGAIQAANAAATGGALLGTELPQETLDEMQQQKDDMGGEPAPPSKDSSQVGPET